MRRLPPSAWIAFIVVLAIASCLLMVCVRVGLTGHFAQGYLIWNLALAVVPVAIATLSMAMLRRMAGRAAKAAGIAAFAAWLVFYPNAPYLFTDFIHVIRRAGLGYVAMPWLSETDLLWYDIVMNASFAFVGHYLGLVSMYIMHGAMRSLFGRTAGWALMAPAILLSGFGIHLGRFSRFDSWDLIVHPMEASRAVRDLLSDPTALLFSLAFAFFIALTYIIFYLVKRSDIGPLDS